MSVGAASPALAVLLNDPVSHAVQVLSAERVGAAPTKKPPWQSLTSLHNACPVLSWYVFPLLHQLQLPWFNELLYLPTAPGEEESGPAKVASEGECCMLESQASSVSRQ